MIERNACLKAFIDALAGDHPYLFEQAVKAAYQAGASREDLLASVEVARRHIPIPAATISRAYAAVHAWHWMIARRLQHQRELVQPQALPSHGVNAHGPGTRPTPVGPGDP